jgi:hypothetical protein
MGMYLPYNCFAHKTPNAARERVLAENMIVSFEELNQPVFYMLLAKLKRTTPRPAGVS